MKVIEAIEIQQIISTINEHNKSLAEDIDVTCGNVLTSQSPVNLLTKSLNDNGTALTTSVYNVKNSLKKSHSAAERTVGENANALVCVTDVKAAVEKQIKTMTDVSLLDKLQELSRNSTLKGLIGERLKALKAAKLAK